MNTQVYADLIIKKCITEAGAYNEVGEDAIRITIKKALDEKYDELIDVLNLKMELDSKNCIYNAAFYEKELKKIDKAMREYVSELVRIE